MEPIANNILLIVSVLSPIIALIGSGTIVWAAWIKTRSEKRDIDGSAAETFEGIAARSAGRIAVLEEEKEKEKEEKKKLAEKVECLDGKVGELSHRLDVSEQTHLELKEENMVLRESLLAAESRISVIESENVDMKEYIARLIHQVRSLGGIPVEMKVKLPATPRTRKK